MGFLASLSQWLKRDGANHGIPPASVEDVPDLDEDGSKRRSEPGSGDEPHRIAVGASCLLTVTERRFMVEIVEETDDTIRVSFPGIDYPIEGMLVDLEFHDNAGFSYYQSKVIVGPQKDGDGVLLERPSDELRSQHRDSVRVPVDLGAELKVQGHAVVHEGTVVNMSTGGAMIDSTTLFDNGATLDMVLDIPGETTASLIIQVLHVSPDSRQSDAGPVHSYGTRFVGYEPGAGRAVTRFIWKRLKELYPAV